MPDASRMTVGRYLRGQPRAVAARAAALALVACVLLPASDGGAQRLRSTEPQYTAEGPARCLACHAAPRMRIMAETVHGNRDNPLTPYANHGCESCHGPGSLHASRARGGIGFPEMLAFDDDEDPGRQTQACLDCHAEDLGELDGMQWAGSVHDFGEISCVDCHSLHAVGNPLTTREAQIATCDGCHDEQIANHRTFEDVGIVFEQLNCSNCHDVHQMIREP